MRTVLCTEIIQNVKEMCIEANHFLSSDMKKALETAKKKEHSPLGTQILGQLEEKFADCSRGQNSNLSRYGYGSIIC